LPPQEFVWFFLKVEDIEISLDPERRSRDKKAEE
jgi:hypothetical protein